MVNYEIGKSVYIFFFPLNWKFESVNSNDKRFKIAGKTYIKGRYNFGN